MKAVFKVQNVIEIIPNSCCTWWIRPIIGNFVLTSHENEAYSDLVFLNNLKSFQHMATKLFVHCTHGLSVLYAECHVPRLHNFEEQKYNVKMAFADDGRHFETALIRSQRLKLSVIRS